MSFSVNTNTNSLAALETLSHTQQSLTKTQNRVSSGLKVAGAADDASTFAIAQGQRGDIAGFQAQTERLPCGDPSRRLGRAMPVPLFSEGEGPWKIAQIP